MKIVELLESESNQDSKDEMFNRVDIKAKNEKGEIILVEIQQIREFYYLRHLLYGVSKDITEHVKLGNKYDQVMKALGMPTDIIAQVTGLGVEQIDKL